MGQGDPRLAQRADCIQTLSGGLTSRLKACEAVCCRNFKILTGRAQSFCRQMQEKHALLCPLLPSSCPANGQLHIVPLTANVYTSS